MTWCLNLIEYRSCWQRLRSCWRGWVMVLYYELCFIFIHWFDAMLRRVLILCGQSPPAHLICSRWTDWPSTQIPFLSMLQRAVHRLLLDQFRHYGARSDGNNIWSFFEKRVSFFPWFSLSSFPFSSTLYSWCWVRLKRASHGFVLCYLILCCFVLITLYLKRRVILLRRGLCRGEESLPLSSSSASLFPLVVVLITVETSQSWLYFILF